MYIYELPFDINKDLCRLLDNDDDWKELAGVHMKYSPFDVNEIEQDARRQVLSPTNQLFVRWGQQNHHAEELFILLYRMKHVPAMKTLLPLVDGRFHRLMMKHSSGRVGCKEKETADVDVNANKPKPKPDGSESSLPLPVMLIENGVQLPTSSNVVNVVSRTDDSSSENNTSSNGMVPQDMHAELLKNVQAIPVIEYKDLKEATDNWSDANLLGKGGFGNVYKGIWTLLPVAVKRLRDVDKGKNAELIRELCVNQYRYDNILPLYGYSLGGPETCLVYQLMAGGSLEQRLRGKTQHPPLTWCKRYRIAHGVSRGLQYLHNMKDKPPLIHGDIKPANILLDQCTVPKIGDFGLARKGPYGDDKTHMKVSRPQGTRPYLPHEYLTTRCLSPAVDVFSFGVVLAELATCLSAWDRAREQPFLSDFVAQLHRKGVDFATFEDRVLKGTPDSNPELCRAFVSLAIECTNATRKDRPTMLMTYRRIDSMHCTGGNDIVPEDMR